MYVLKNGLGVELPERYIINENACILFWKDGTKTIVKKAEDDEFNPRIAYLTAFFQKYCGLSKNKANKLLANLQVEGEINYKKYSELNVGDEVTIKKDLEAYKKYGNQCVVLDMRDHAGQKAIITKNFGDGRYHIDKDYGCWYWTKEMFE